MPGRRRGSYGRRGMGLSVIHSIKNSLNFGQGTTGTLASNIIAKAVNTPLNTNRDEVGQGSKIKAIWVSIDGCGLGGTGVLNIMNIYIMKNPGANLTAPDPRTIGSSNEKKFIFKQWQFMIMRNQDGNTPFHWEGWVKIPRVYQRMGTDDTIIIVFQNSASVTGHFSDEFIYKWYT